MAETHLSRTSQGAASVLAAAGPDDPARLEQPAVLIPPLQRGY